jgi:DNA-binding NtrC family response regulator
MNPSETEKQRPTALIVDDEYDVREMLSEALKTYGFDIILAADGEEAWDLFQKNDPHLIISDIYMPKKNGLMLLKQIKEVAPRRTVILMTGYQHYQQLIESEAHPPDGFINKPFRFEDLYAMITEAIVNANFRAV